jgi:hypothetical protein
VQLGLTRIDARDNSNCLTLLLEEVKAATSVIILDKAVETATLNTSPIVTCWRMQGSVLGFPRNSKAQRKQQMRGMHRILLTAWLLAFTTGVSCCFKENPQTPFVSAQSHAGQSHLQGVFEIQKAHSFQEAVVSFCCILMI